MQRPLRMEFLEHPQEVGEFLVVDTTFHFRRTQVIACCCLPGLNLTDYQVSAFKFKTQPLHGLYKVSRRRVSAY